MRTVKCHWWPDTDQHGYHWQQRNTFARNKWIFCSKILKMLLLSLTGHSSVISSIFPHGQVFILGALLPAASCVQPRWASVWMMLAGPHPLLVYNRCAYAWLIVLRGQLTRSSHLNSCQPAPGNTKNINDKILTGPDQTFGRQYHIIAATDTIRWPTLSRPVHISSMQ